MDNREESQHDYEKRCIENNLRDDGVFLNTWTFEKKIRKLTKHTLYNKVQHTKHGLCNLCGNSHWANETTLNLREAIECIDRHFEKDSVNTNGSKVRTHKTSTNRKHCWSSKES